jgi:glutamine synthetase
MSKDVKWVLGELKGVRFVQVWFTDILGAIKSLTIPAEAVADAFEEGKGFDGSSIEGFTRIDESDMCAWPDPTTFVRTGGDVARMMADIKNPDGTPFDGDPRYVLRRALERVGRKGWTVTVAPELEFFLFKSATAPEPVDRGGYFDAVGDDFCRDVAASLAALGIASESAHHEGAHGQFELDLKASDALSMADAVVSAKFVVRELAAKRGLHATFMPKPLDRQNGSGMHLHIAFLKGERNAFFDARTGLSETARKAISGLLAHAPDLMLVTNPTLNSYKRLVPGYEAPVYTTWSMRNRGDLIRVPTDHPGKEKAARIEYRAPDPAASPYLAFAVLVEAMLDGVERGLDCPAPLDENAASMTPEARAERKIRELPGSLIESIHLAEKSALLRRVLGDHVFENLLACKRIEWDDFRTKVTAYEVERYLPLL